MDEFDYLDTVDLIDWAFDAMLTVDWPSENHTRGTSPARAVLIVEGPTLGGGTRLAVVPSTAIPPAEFVDLMRRAGELSTLAGETHALVSETEDGEDD